MTYIVRLDKDLCIGCGACTVACTNFVAAGEKVAVIASEISDAELESNTDAMHVCPVAAIQIEKR